MQIYINRNGQQLGPFEEAGVIEMLRNGQLSPNDFGIKEGQQNWQKLGEMFPQPAQPVWTPPVNQPNFQVNQQAQPTPSKTGSSKGLIFGLLGCGGFLLLGIVGIVGFIILKNSSTKTTYNVSNNVSNTNTISNAPTPPPDPYKEDSERRTKFESHEADFVKLPAKVQITKQPYIKGKVAFYNRDVEVGEKDSFWLLDNNFAGSSSIDEKVKDIKARTPEEVQTVVLRNCKQYKKGNYIAAGRTIPGYNWNCEITIIDRTIPAVIHRKSFQGLLANEVKIRSTDTKIEAYIPYTEIADFLGKLPRN